MMAGPKNEYTDAEYASRYLETADEIPHRREAEEVLLGFIPKSATRVLDLGCGDGRLLHLLKLLNPQIVGVAVDASPTMRQAAKERLRDFAELEVLEHNFEDSLPDLGTFHAVVSSFAIHHIGDKRKRELYAEIYACLVPGGVFCNLEHVAPASPNLHRRFLEALGVAEGDEDPSNQLASVETQVDWLRAIGYVDADCHWKWLELALFGGSKPG